MKLKKTWQCFLLLFLFTQSNHALETEVETATSDLTPQVVKVAKKVEQRFELYSSAKQTTENQIVIARPGATFIKVHFDKLVLPNGAYVEVSNLDGTETYRYSKEKRSPFTFDAESGDDGRNSFSAMSITGDIAVVRLVGNSAVFKPSTHRVVVDSFMEGFSQQEIDEVLSNPFLFSQGGELVAESTCGVNERRDVACWEDSHPVEFERSRPVARILIGGGSLCTAWRVGADNHMFTNEHCVNSQSGIQNTEVWFNYQRTSCGGSLGTTTKVTGNTLLQTGYALDYTLFTVNDFATIQGFGHFGLDVREATDQEVIYIPQHGSGNPKELAIESDQNVDNLCRVDDVSAAGRAANSDMGYFCDTIGGSSGSPVLARQTNNVIALHHFGGCTNQGVKIVNIWPEVSSYFGGVVPVGDNGGSSGTTVAAPSNLSGSKIVSGKGKKATISSIDLSWSDNSDNEDGFSIERCVETGKGKNKTCPFTVLTTVGANSSSYSDPVGASGTYRYRVRAFGTDTETGNTVYSSYSNTVEP